MKRAVTLHQQFSLTVESNCVLLSFYIFSALSQVPINRAMNLLLELFSVECQNYFGFTTF